MTGMGRMAGKTALVTGANTGIGAQTALGLAREGARLFLAGRSESRHEEVLGELASLGTDVTFLQVDLGELASVKACAERFLALDSPLHLLVNNAGLAGKRGLSEDGFELTFGVNHLGPFLLTELLIERLKASAPARIVNVASMAHYDAKPIPWDRLRERTPSVTGIQEYAVSKLCNVLYAKELSERLADAGVTTYSLHPGVIGSDVWRNIPLGLGKVIRRFMKTPEQGAQTSLHCAMAPELATDSGLYYDSCKPKTPSDLALDAALARELTERSRQLVGLS